MQAISITVSRCPASDPLRTPDFVVLIRNEQPKFNFKVIYTPQDNFEKKKKKAEKNYSRLKGN